MLPLVSPTGPRNGDRADTEDGDHETEARAAAEAEENAQNQAPKPTPFGYN